MLIIGCDYHPGFQQIALVDTGTGELQERRPKQREEAEEVVAVPIYNYCAINEINVVKERNAVALALLRIAIGCLFLVFAQYKVFGRQFTLGGGFQWWINRFLQDGTAYPFMVPLLRQFVLAHATVIAFLVAYGELAIGLSLLLGTWVRTASAFGAAYMLSLLFSSNYPGSHAPLWQYFGASLDHSVLCLCFLAFVVGHSDEALSLKSYQFRIRR